MAKFPSLGDDASALSIMKMYPDFQVPLVEAHEVLMRGDSPLSEGEREVIAAYVSGLNECAYCYGVHSQASVSYGFDDSALRAMVDDPAAAEIDEKLKPLLAYVGKLTLKPAGVTDADAQAVYDAGWDERALHEAILVTCLFNFMNRLLEGHGVHGHEAMYRERGALLKEHGYLPLVRMLRPKAKTGA